MGKSISGLLIHIPLSLLIEFPRLLPPQSLFFQMAAGEKAATAENKRKQNCTGTEGLREYETPLRQTPAANRFATLQQTQIGMHGLGRLVALARVARAGPEQDFI